MEVSQETKDLIDRMCRNVERKDFKLNKKKAEECLMKTYDLFDLQRPKQVVWLSDPFEEFEDKASSASSARLALSASSARLALSASPAGSANSANSAWLAGSASSANSVWSANSANSAGSVWSVLSVWSALHYDFDHFVVVHEYCKNRDGNPGEEPNENDYKYLEYSELLMQAKEYGMGYRVEHEGVLYCVPTPLVLFDEQNKFHSTERPAVRWKKGKELYFLHGVKFEKELWDRVVSGEVTGKEVVSMGNTEQKMAAIKTIGIDRVFSELGAKLVDKSERGNELYLVEDVFSQPAKFVRKVCPSTGRVYFEGVHPSIEGADEAVAWQMDVTAEDYSRLKVES